MADPIQAGVYVRYQRATSCLKRESGPCQLISDLTSDMEIFIDQQASQCVTLYSYMAIRGTSSESSSSRVHAASGANITCTSCYLCLCGGSIFRLEELRE